VNAIAHRGGDGVEAGSARTWSGHRLLLTIPENQGNSSRCARAKTAHHHRDLRLDNRETLIAQLNLQIKPRPLSDSLLVLKAYSSGAAAAPKSARRFCFRSLDAEQEI